MEIKFPLNRLSRFCREYQAVLGNCEIEINITMSNYVAQIVNTSTLAAFLTSPNNVSTRNGGLNAVFGAPNAQMIIQPFAASLDYVTYLPSPQSQIRLNALFKSKFTVDFIDCDCSILPATWNISTRDTITNMELPNRRHIYYLIIAFKNANTASTTQNYGGFVNGNVNAMQARYGTSAYVPAQPQQNDFTMVSNTSFCSGPKHFYGQYRNLFERWHSGKELPMSESEFRNLYTMYCFDFTDVNQGNKTLETAISVTISRIRNSTEVSSTYECYYALYYKRTVVFDFTTNTPTVEVD
jgi:hypothetical protein